MKVVLLRDTVFYRSHNIFCASLKLMNFCDTCDLLVNSVSLTIPLFPEHIHAYYIMFQKYQHCNVYITI